MSLQVLVDEIVEEMRKLVKDVHKIPQSNVGMNRHAYRMAVLIDLSVILERILPYAADNGREQKYRLMARKDLYD